MIAALTVAVCLAWAGAAETRSKTYTPEPYRPPTIQYFDAGVPSIHYQHQQAADAYMREHAPGAQFYVPPGQTAPKPGTVVPLPPGGTRALFTAPADGSAGVPAGRMRLFKDTFAETVRDHVAASSSRNGRFVAADAQGRSQALRLRGVREETISVHGSEASGVAEFDSLDIKGRRVALEFKLVNDGWDWTVASAAPAGGAQAAKAPKPGQPARLSVSVAFEEPSGDGRVEGGEAAAISVTVRNEGAGAAYGVTATAEPQREVRGLQVAPLAEFGDLAPGASATRALSVRASDKVASARAAVALQILEANGFDGDRVVVEFETRPLVPPKLEVVEVAAAGGSVRAGEAVPVTVLVRNSGSGPADGVTAELVARGDDVLITSEASMPLGRVEPGGTAKASFELFVKKRFPGGELPVSVRVAESRGRFGAGPSALGLALGSSGPRRVSVASSGEEAEDVETPPAARTPLDRNAYAVVVGVERYRDLPSASYAARDARTVHAYLTRAMGIPAENSVLLTDERASLADLTTHLGPWLKDRVRKGGRVFVYFSGHGAPHPASGEPFLVPYDGSPRYTETKAFALRQLYALLGSLPAREVIVALDSCFSGTGGRSVLPQGLRPLVPVRTAEPAANTVVLAASAADQVSSSHPGARHGMLTYHLLRGLRGSADADGDRKVTTGELFAFVRPAVEDAARRQHIEQSPTLTPDVKDLGPRAGGVWLVRQD